MCQISHTRILWFHSHGFTLPLFGFLLSYSVELGVKCTWAVRVSYSVTQQKCRKQTVNDMVYTRFIFLVLFSNLTVTP